MNLKAKYFAELQARIATASERILDNRCENMEQYGYQCGLILGMKLAMEDFDTVLSESVSVKEELEEMNDSL